MSKSRNDSRRKSKFDNDYQDFRRDIQEKTHKHRERLIKNRLRPSNIDVFFDDDGDDE